MTNKVSISWYTLIPKEVEPFTNQGPHLRFYIRKDGPCATKYDYELNKREHYSINAHNAQIKM